MPALPTSLDLVYTWVDGERTDYQAIVRRHATRPRDQNPERYRDSLALLRWSLRSVEQFCPWVNRVWLFTMRPHVPEWLRRDHPRLTVVHHDEVMAPRHLPTFSCNVIESHLHLLPGLGKQFLYMNDDFLFGAPTSLRDFFSTDGRIKVFGTFFGERQPQRIYDGKNVRISRALLEHAPILIDRNAWTEMLTQRPEEIEATRSHRFRETTDLRFDFWWRQYLLSRPDLAVAEPAWKLLRNYCFFKMTPSVLKQRIIGTVLRQRRPKFYCLNDDQGPAPNPRVLELAREYLEETYPHASSFERVPWHPQCLSQAQRETAN